MARVILNITFVNGHKESYTLEEGSSWSKDFDRGLLFIKPHSETGPPRYELPLSNILSIHVKRVEDPAPQRRIPNVGEYWFCRRRYVSAVKVLSKNVYPTPSGVDYTFMVMSRADSEFEATLENLTRPATLEEIKGYHRLKARNLSRVKAFDTYEASEVFRQTMMITMEPNMAKAVKFNAMLDEVLNFLHPELDDD